ncbi:hypothetical protein JCM8097_002418 [Rhodosporidiobolus ruineniae]
MPRDDPDQRHRRRDSYRPDGMPDLPPPPIGKHYRPNPPPPTANAAPYGSYDNPIQPERVDTASELDAQEDADRRRGERFRKEDYRRQVPTPPPAAQYDEPQYFDSEQWARDRAAAKAEKRRRDHERWEEQQREDNRRRKEERRSTRERRGSIHPDDLAYARAAADAAQRREEEEQRLEEERRDFKRRLEDERRARKERRNSVYREDVDRARAAAAATAAAEEKERRHLREEDLRRDDLRGRSGPFERRRSIYERGRSAAPPSRPFFRDEPERFYREPEPEPVPVPAPAPRAVPAFRHVQVVHDDPLPPPSPPRYERHRSRGPAAEVRYVSSSSARHSTRPAAEYAPPYHPPSTSAHVHISNTVRSRSTTGGRTHHRSFSHTHIVEHHRAPPAVDPDEMDRLADRFGRLGDEYDDGPRRSRLSRYEKRRI